MERSIRARAGSWARSPLATLLLGGLAAALVARRISRPVQQLAEGAAAISRGELDQRVEPTTDDEIGRLAATFNHMTTQLRQQRAALEDANSELRRGFEELADLKSYTDNVLASLTTGIVTVDLDGPRGHPQSGRRADDRLLRRRGARALLHRGVRAHARARRDPDGDDRQPGAAPRDDADPAPARRADAAGGAVGGAPARRRGQGSRRDRGDPRSHRGARAREPPASLRPARGPRRASPPASPTRSRTR